jgi:hypothetical protein
MGVKKQIRTALVDGATEGLAGDKLFAYVVDKVPDVPTRKIVRTALLTLSDPSLTDRNILNVIYALALKYRLAE